MEGLVNTFQNNRWKIVMSLLIIIIIMIIIMFCMIQSNKENFDTRFRTMKNLAANKESTTYPGDDYTAPNKGLPDPNKDVDFEDPLVAKM